jgi:hypothetical protein
LRARVSRRKVDRTGVRMPDMTGPASEAPARDSSRRRSRPRLTVPGLLAFGAALVLAALISWVGLALTQIDGYRWSDDAMVPDDGRPHTVELNGEGTAMLWSYEAYTAPTCTLVDAATGSDLRLRSSNAGYWREGGSAGDWLGAATFEPPSSTVEVTCGEPGEGSGFWVAVEAAPALPPPLALFGPWLALPIGLSLAGLFAVAAAVLLHVRRRGRPPRTR